MSEMWFARFDAGPLEGTRQVDGDRVPFPGPETIEDFAEAGLYVRVRHSQLEANVHPNVVRGAEYHWEPVNVKEPSNVV